MDDHEPIIPAGTVRKRATGPLADQVLINSQGPGSTIGTTERYTPALLCLKVEGDGVGTVTLRVGGVDVSEATWSFSDNRVVEIGALTSHNGGLPGVTNGSRLDYSIACGAGVSWNLKADVGLTP